MEILQNYGTESKYNDITNYLTDNHITPASVDNYQLDPSSISLLDAMGANHAIKGMIVSIFYKDLDRNAILDNGLSYRRIRLSDSDVAQGHPKYLSPAGSSNHIYIPASFKSVYESAGKKTIFITEGEKKADVACASGIPCIALSGIYSWAERDDAEKHIMPELIYLIKTLSVDTAIVIFDSDGDLITKDEINAAERKLLKIETLSSGKFVKNSKVRKAASALATAIAIDTKVKVAHGFCKHIIEEKTFGNVKHLKIFVKNGLDDWLVNDRKEAHNHLAFLESISVIPVVAKEKAYEPLGYMSTATETTAVVYRKDLDEIKFAPYTKFNTNTISMLIGEADAMRYQRESDSGLLQFDSVRASRDIKLECDSTGRWNMDSIKELGLWKTATGQLIVNTQNSPYLIVGSELEETTRFIRDTREYFTAKRGQVSESMVSLSAVHRDFPTSDEVENAISDLSSLLSPFYFENHSTKNAAFILVSWMLGQLYTGITEIRPHIYVDGPAGCGKTTILKIMAHALKGHAQYIANGRDSSVAGIMGMIGKSATTMIIDEMEISDKEVKFGVDSKLEAFMGIIKSSYSSSEVGVDSVKGTQDGGFRSAGAKAGFLFASLNKGSVDMATETRILTLTVRAKKADEPTYKVQSACGSNISIAIDSDEYYALAEKAGAVLMRFFMSEEVYKGYTRSLKTLKRRLTKRLGMRGRMMNTFAYLYAPLIPVMLYNQKGDQTKGVKTLVTKLVNIINGNHALFNTVTRPQCYELLDNIMHAKARKPTYLKDSNGTRQGSYMDSTIGKLITEAVESHDPESIEALNNLGVFLIVKPEQTKEQTLIYMHSSVMKALSGSDVKKFKTLETISGATKEERRRFNDIQHRVIGVPYSVVIGS
jgi:energy-coupling factor transporter ATP-binding protein EcfA2